MDCAICCEPLGKGATTTPCHHRMHAACLATWQTRSATCPICRTALPRALSPEALATMIQKDSERASDEASDKQRALNRRHGAETRILALKHDAQRYKLARESAEKRRRLFKSAAAQAKRLKLDHDATAHLTAASAAAAQAIDASQRELHAEDTLRALRTQLAARP